MEIGERIIAACGGLARTQGFRAMTVDELAYRAGVSKRTLYRYFKGKNILSNGLTFEETAGQLLDCSSGSLSKNRPPHRSRKRSCNGSGKAIRLDYNSLNETEH